MSRGSKRRPGDEAKYRERHERTFGPRKRTPVGAVIARDLRRMLDRDPDPELYRDPAPPGVMVYHDGEGATVRRFAVAPTEGE